MSSKLFITTLEDIFKYLKWENKSINVSGEKLTNLKFSDDIDILITPQSKNEMTNMIYDLYGTSKIEIQVNFSKTKHITNQEDRVTIKSKKSPPTHTLVKLIQQKDQQRIRGRQNDTSLESSKNTLT